MDSSKIIYYTYRAHGCGSTHIAIMLNTKDKTCKIGWDSNWMGDGEIKKILNGKIISITKGIYELKFEDGQELTVDTTKNGNYQCEVGLDKLFNDEYGDTFFLQSYGNVLDGVNGKFHAISYNKKEYEIKLDMQERMFKNINTEDDDKKKKDKKEKKDKKSMIPNTSMKLPLFNVQADLPDFYTNLKEKYLKEYKEEALLTKMEMTNWALKYLGEKQFYSDKDIQKEKNRIEKLKFN